MEQPSSSKDKIEEAVKQYTSQRSLYEALAKKVETVIREVLDSEGVEYHSVVSRAKEIDSFHRKASTEKYSDPINEIKDKAGVRIITYVESEARRIADIINSLFNVVTEHSVDKSKTLGIDRMGYRSVHYVARFPLERYKLPEYKRFEGMEFEVQVRTILQHAWAEIEHDRNYKFTGILPDEIRRRFAVLAGVLELADREFDEIACNIDNYAKKVAFQAKSGKLDIPINTTSLRQYLKSKFPKAVPDMLIPEFGLNNSGASAIVKELAVFGISTLSELDSIIPTDFEKRLLKGAESSTFVGILRDIMLINDAERYFQNVWDASWDVISPESLDFLKSYRVDLRKFVTEGKLFIAHY